ncbi:MAG: ribbon-helix-helix domain-containing protein [Actinomycetes bacterium]
MSLPDEDVKFLDEYAEQLGIESRSAVVHRAVRLLQASEMGAAYQAAWEEWAAGDADSWEPTVADGLG